MIAIVQAAITRDNRPVALTGPSKQLLLLSSSRTLPSSLQCRTDLYMIVLYVHDVCDACNVCDACALVSSYHIISHLISTARGEKSTASKERIFKDGG